ncbi:unnamed protein product [Clonostachys rosea]|uniref:Uncharacterized protein n=1 Tax=Bionectria ochroleuca TaxID=29856 RepID=A0ABY6UPK6_BIOOC|nr:unnamed protein product [Clonostachys rosea]
MPALKASAANPGRLDVARVRFDGDEPPAYYSTTESPSERGDDLEPMPDLEEVASALAAPLNETDLENLVGHMQEKGLTYPGRRYVRESILEVTKLSSFVHSYQCNSKTKRYLIGEKALERYAVIVRHYIKKRWQRLGVWDSSWGIPGRVLTHFEDGVRVRNPRPPNLRHWEPLPRCDMPDEDNEELWRWKKLPEYMPSDPRDPIRRAVELRRGLRRGESIQLPPRDNLASDASSEELEDFLISRPFFVFEVEAREEISRQWKVPERKGKPVIWKEKGDWTEEWAKRDYNQNYVIGWKWPNESDGSEAIDYSELNSRKNIDFTPSEIDALDAIEARYPIPPISIAAQVIRYKHTAFTLHPRRSARIAEIKVNKALASSGTAVVSNPGRSQQPEMEQRVSRRGSSSRARAGPSTAKAKGATPNSAVAPRARGRGAKKDTKAVADAAFKPLGVKKRGRPRKSLNPPSSKTGPRKRTTAPNEDSGARII